MEINVGDIITFTYYSNGGDINVDFGAVYSGSTYDAVVVFKTNLSVYVCLPTKSGIALMHRVEPSYISKVITPYNKFIEGL